MWLGFCIRLGLGGALFFVVADAIAQDKGIASRTEDVDGVRLHYLTAGGGPAAGMEGSR